MASMTRVIKEDVGAFQRFYEAQVQLTNKLSRAIAY
jgi:hypothetical protein